jgi:hypothetical protein
MLTRKRPARGRLLFGLAFFLIFGLGHVWADGKVTRVYVLKNASISNMSRVLDIVVRDPTKTRVIAGDGSKLVVTDTPDQQDTIAQLLPILDQPTNEPTPEKTQMKMMMNAAAYLRQQKLALKAQPASGNASGAVSAPSASSSNNGLVATYDKFSSTNAYKSVYASDDAKILAQRRLVPDEPAIPSLSALELKGIYKSNTSTPLALLEYGGAHYVARDGGLFENNRSRVKNVTSQILKDRVILTGLDRIPREIKFRSSI